MKNEAFRKAHFDGWKKNETEPSERSILVSKSEGGFSGEKTLGTFL
ncbi:7294_t:CDS:2 [Rhizophagus irregularis]|nr:7294_t:CDS:2 [Rhizophagus irregularis]